MHRPFKQLTLGMLLVLATAITSAQTTPPALSTFSFKEATAQFRKTINPDGQNAQCGYVQADARYKAKKGAPNIAVELDDVLYVKYQGRLIALKTVKENKQSTNYADNTSGLRINIRLIKQFNRSEYGESEDRLGDLTVSNSANKVLQRLKVAGWSCGV